MDGIKAAMTPQMECGEATTRAWRSWAEISRVNSSMEERTRYLATLIAAHRQERTRQPTRTPEPSYELQHQGSSPLDQPRRAASCVTDAIYAQVSLESGQLLP